MRPRFPRVGRLVDAVAGCEIGANDPGATSHVEDVGVTGRYGDRPNRPGGLLVEQRHPRRAVVGRAPYPAVVESDVEDVGLTRDTGQAAGAPGARGTDLAPTHLGVERGGLGG